MGCLKLTYWNEMEIPTWRDSAETTTPNWQVWVNENTENECKEVIVDQNGRLQDVTGKFYQQLALTELFFTHAKEMFDKENFTVPGNKKVEKLRFFANMVKTGAPFDIKQPGKGFSFNEIGKKAIFEGKVYEFDDFGNINFGYAAKIFGIPLDEAVKSAGIYQTLSQGNPDYSNWEGFFDATKDTRNIKFGYNFVPIWER